MSFTKRSMQMYFGILAQSSLLIPGVHLTGAPCGENWEEYTDGHDTRNNRL